MSTQRLCVEAHTATSSSLNVKQPSYSPSMPAKARPTVFERVLSWVFEKYCTLLASFLANCRTSAMLAVSLQSMDLAKPARKKVGLAVSIASGCGLLVCAVCIDEVNFLVCN